MKLIKQGALTRKNCGKIAAWAYRIHVFRSPTIDFFAKLLNDKGEKVVYFGTKESFEAWVNGAPSGAEVGK